MPAAASPPAPVVLVHGDDDFAVKQRARHLYQQWTAELGGMDHETIDARSSNSAEALRALSRLREALQTLPFFGSGKAIWFQDCNFLGDERTAGAQAVTESLAALAQELKSFPWENVRLLLTSGKVDKRKTFYKTVEKLGSVEYHQAWSLEDKNWAAEAESTAQRAITARKKEISEEALAALVNQVGPHREQLNNEVEKLLLFAGDRTTIQLADVHAVVIRNKQARAFALADALGDRNLPGLLRALDEQLWELQFDRKKSEIGILYGLISKIRMLIFLKEMLREGWIKPASDYGRFKAQLDRLPAGQLPEDKRFNPLSMHPYMLYKALPQAHHYSSAELVHAMDLLLQCNQSLISSGLDESLVLHQTLVQIVRGDGASRSTPARGA